MTARRLISVDDVRGQPGLSHGARDEVVRSQPTTVLEALRIRGVGRKTTKRLVALGLLTDPKRVQTRPGPMDAGAADLPARRP